MSVRLALAILRGSNQAQGDLLLTPPRFFRALGYLELQESLVVAGDQGLLPPLQCRCHVE